MYHNKNFKLCKHVKKFSAIPGTLSFPRIVGLRVTLLIEWIPKEQQ